MGPFELSDLVGVDIGFEIAKSFHELSFGEPRWRPSPLRARSSSRRAIRPQERPRLVRLRGRPAPPGRPRAAEAGRRRRAARRDRRRRADRRPAARARRERRLRRGRAARRRRRRPVAGRSTAAPTPRTRRSRAARSRCCARTARSTRWTASGGAVGFHVLPPLEAAARRAHPQRHDDRRRRRARRGVLRRASAGTWRGSSDAPGLVLGRIVCQLVNEAAFAVAEGVGTPTDIDDGMVLGLNHPRGPFGWARRHRPDPRAGDPRRPARRARRGALPRRAAAAADGDRGVTAGARGLTPEAPVRLFLVTNPPFQRFLDAHRDDVWRFLVAAVGRDAADDCFQETFMAALRAYPKTADREPAGLGADDRAPQDARPPPRAQAPRRCPWSALPDVPAPPDPSRATTASGRASATLPPKQRAARPAALRRRPHPPRGRGGDGHLGGGRAPLAVEGLRTLRQEMTA